MPDADLTLPAKAQQQEITDSEVAMCWQLLLEGIQLGWYDRAEIQNLINHLHNKRSLGSRS